MIRSLALVSAIACLSTGGEAYAQANYQEMETGTRFAREPETADEAEGRWMQKRLAMCVFNRDEDLIREVLANSNFSYIDFDALPVEPDNFFDEIDFDHCMGRLFRGASNRTYHLSVQMPFSTLRNLLAEEAYLRDYGEPPVIEPTTPQEVWGRFQGSPAPRQVAVVARWGDCLTHNAPDAAHELLDSRPGSGSEEEALNALTPVFETCIGDAGGQQSISTSLIRQIAADGMWSRSYYGSAGSETGAGGS